MSTLFAKTRALMQRRISRGGGPSSPNPPIQPAPRLTAVGLVDCPQERKLLVDIGIDHGWEVQFADTCAEAIAASDPRRVPVILCDRDLPSSDWRDAVQTLAASSRPACVILLSNIVDDSLWEEVIRHGGYDVLAKPLRRSDVIRVVKLARSFWCSMMKMPAYSRTTSSLSSR